MERPGAYAGVVMGALLLGLLAAADASQVMAEYGDRVAEVQVLGTQDENVDARSVIGSGWWADDGLLVTNFHVVSELVWFPKSHRLQVVRGTEKLKGTLVEIDPPHDLAVIRVEGAAHPHLTLAPDPAHGATLFALGHPHDIGLSIVAGTFNGRAEGELQELFHFSGSLNSGMSGGPCVDEHGQVVGVNVASMGNQVSFLVPGKWVKALLERAAAQKEPPDFLERVKETVLESQQALAAELLSQPMSTTTLGAWQLPAGWPAKDLRAWGGPLNEENPDDLFTVSAYQVFGRAMTTLKGGSEATGSVVLRHRLYEAKSIGPVQLYRRAGDGFARDAHDSPGDDEDFHTKWSCDQRAFSQGGSRLRSYLCLRAYKKIDGVYDYVLRVMTFDEPRATVVAELQLYGFSPDNAELLQRRFLEALQWKR